MNLRSPNDILAVAKKKYGTAHKDWLIGGGQWPLTIRLGSPTEREAVSQVTAVRAWVSQWEAQQLGVTVDWEQRTWPRLGTQRLPAQVWLDSPEAVAQLVGESRRWATAKARYVQMCSCWPVFAGSTVLARYFEELSDYSEDDFNRLTRLLTWLLENPDSQCYVRQLPIPGLDTKWIGGGSRKGLVTDLMRVLQNAPDAQDFHEVCGLRKTAHRIRMRVLCPRLRQLVGGLADIEAPLADLCALPLRPSRVLVVENQETGVALPDLPGTVVFMRLGNAVNVLGDVPWLRETPVTYWGDLDTYGFAILARARKALPHAQSLLMDEATLLNHQALWVDEPKQTAAAELSYLTPEEQFVYAGLLAQTWGPRVRLEQERLVWPEVLLALERLEL